MKAVGVQGFKGSGFSAAAGHRKASQIEKETLQFHTSAASGLKNGQSYRERN
jgi:hypothetical protein